MNVWPHTSQLLGLNKHVCFSGSKKLEVLSASVPINKNNKKGSLFAAVGPPCRFKQTSNSSLHSRISH